MISYRVLHRLGFRPWERRPVEEFWDRVEGTRVGAPSGRRALDIGCGTGRDAVVLAMRGWDVTGIDFSEQAIAEAKKRAAETGVRVEWHVADVAGLGHLGLEPGFSLLYDIGCIQGLSDDDRRSAFAGLTALAAPGAELHFFAFQPGSRMLLPRGMGEADVVTLLGPNWDHVETRSAVEEGMPRPVRRAGPTMYHFLKR